MNEKITAADLANAAIPGFDFDPTTGEYHPVDYAGYPVCPVCAEPTSALGRLCTYCDDEPDDEVEHEWITDGSTVERVPVGTYRCRYCKRTVEPSIGDHLPNDRCPKAGPKGWHLWKRVKR